MEAPDLSDAHFDALLEEAESEFNRWLKRELLPERDKQLNDLMAQKLGSGGRALKRSQIYRDLLARQVRKRIDFYAGVARRAGNAGMLSDVRLEEFQERIMTSMGHAILALKDGNERDFRAAGDLSPAAWPRQQHYDGLKSEISDVVNDEIRVLKAEGKVASHRAERRDGVRGVAGGAMPHTIPPFPEFNLGNGAARFPGSLPSQDATLLERIHKRLRSSVSHRPDRFEQLVCHAVQECYDLLKQIYARRGAFNDYVLEEALSENAFEIALECGWLPKGVRADDPKWRTWIRELLAGRFDRVGLGGSSKPDPYLFVPFPVAANSGERAAGTLPSGGSTNRGIAEGKMADIPLPGLDPTDPRSILSQAARKRISDVHADADLVRARALASIEARYRSEPDSDKTLFEYQTTGQAGVEWAQAKVQAAGVVLCIVRDEFRAAGKSGRELRRIMEGELEDAVYSLELTTIQRDLLWHELGLDRYAVQEPTSATQGIAKGATHMGRPARPEIEKFANDAFAVARDRILKEHADQQRRALDQAELVGNRGAYFPALIKCEAQHVRETILALADAYVEAFTIHGVPSDTRVDLRAVARQVTAGAISGIRGHLRLRSGRLRIAEEGRGVPWHLEIERAMDAAVKEGLLRLKRQRIKSGEGRDVPRRGDLLEKLSEDDPNYETIKRFYLESWADSHGLVAEGFAGRVSLSDFVEGCVNTFNQAARTHVAFRDATTIPAKCRELDVMVKESIRLLERALAPESERLGKAEIDAAIDEFSRRVNEIAARSKQQILKGELARTANRSATDGQANATPKGTDLEGVAAGKSEPPPPPSASSDVRSSQTPMNESVGPPLPPYWEKPTPLFYFEKWDLKGLKPKDQSQIKHHLRAIHAGFLEGGTGDQPHIDCWRRAYDVLAKVLFEASLLTEDLVTNGIPAMVADAGASGRWQWGRSSFKEPNSDFTERFGNEFFAPWYIHSYFLPYLEGRIFEWQGKLLIQTDERAGEHAAATQSPVLAEPPSALTNASGTDRTQGGGRQDAGEGPTAGTKTELPVHLPVKDATVDLLERILEERPTTLAKWAGQHRFGRTTVFDWKSLRGAGKPLMGKVSTEMSAAIEEAIHQDAKALGLMDPD